MSYVGYYSGKFVDEFTAIGEVIDTAVLSYPQDWLAVNGDFGTDTLSMMWSGRDDSVPSVVQAALEPFIGWFTVQSVALVTDSEGRRSIDVQIALTRNLESRTFSVGV